MIKNNYIAFDSGFVFAWCDRPPQQEHCAMSILFFVVTVIAAMVAQMVVQMIAVSVALLVAVVIVVYRANRTATLRDVAVVALLCNTERSHSLYFVSRFPFQ